MTLLALFSGFAEEDEEFCKMEVRNTDQLQSANNDALEMLDKQLNNNNEDKLPSLNSDQDEQNEESSDEKPGKGTDGNNAPKGFNSFKQLSVAAKASYKWSQLVDKRRQSKAAKKKQTTKSNLK